MNRAPSLILAVSSALLLAGCGVGGEAPEENLGAGVAEPAMTFNGANDLSAVDMAVNESVAEPLPANMAGPAPADDIDSGPEEETPSADQVESNVSGM